MEAGAAGLVFGGQGVPQGIARDDGAQTGDRALWGGAQRGGGGESGKDHTRGTQGIGVDVPDVGAKAQR